MFLLRETDRPVTEICLDVGFTSLGTFSRTFREIVGETPSAYRARAASRAGACRPASRWAWTRPSSFGEAGRARARLASRPCSPITHSGIFVLDQDEALDFYVGKLGLEVNTDVDLGFMRWLTVDAPGEPEREILLEVPGRPDARRRDRRAGPRPRDQGRDRRLVLGLTTDDCRGTYEELKAKGVEFTEEPTERFYGIDCGLRDPFGNHIRITQPTPG